MINLALFPRYMKLLTHITSLFRNKYLVATCVFAVIMLFLDKNDLFTQISRTHQLKELVKSKEYYTQEIASERKQSEQLTSGTATPEKYAREKYYMKRDNEDIYVVPNPPAEGKK
jgi:cell division protein DivIC